ncbi:MAG TPA: hypothetical protein PKV41_02665 [Candidatus Omnitrophota bacterium]|nr:hypothetical protein [Candidatus Omnitrophota bacterium]
MYQPQDLPKSTIKSVISTVKIDRQVYRWFFHLIMQRKLREELVQNEETKAIYRKTDIVLWLERIVYGALAVSLFFAISSKKFEYEIFACAAMGLIFLLYVIKRELIVRVCRRLLDRDFLAVSLSQKTLYQIGEYYSREYDIISLTGAITSSDGIIRTAILMVIICIVFIVPLNFWEICGVVFLAYYLSFGLSWMLVYRRVK